MGPVFYLPTPSSFNLAITYNLLNLQQSLTQNGTTVASYNWLADGTKCGVVDNSGNGYDYTCSLIYSRSGSTRTLESIDNGAGRIYYSGGTYNPFYYLTDHLGSTRAISNGSGTVVERDDYYPFGGQHGNSSYPQLAGNRFKYNGKELQTTGNTGFLDYGARMYDDVIGRWGVVDPMAEKYPNIGPYVFCINNPMRFIDQNGMDWYSYEEEYVDENGESQTRTQYKYVRGEMSAEEMEAGGYTHLGKAYNTDNKYYSLGGAVVNYDKNNIIDRTMVNDIMNADNTVIATIASLKGTENFWKKYDNFISSGLDAANIIGNFMDASKGFIGPIKFLGNLNSALSLHSNIKLFSQNKLQGIALSDAIVNVISFAGVPGAAISLNYTAAKAGANYLVKLNEFLNKFMYKSLTFRP